MLNKIRIIGTRSASHRELVALTVILLVGTWLRFHRLGDIEFNIDQVYPVWQALNTLDNAKFPLVGQGTSVLFANPPLTGYIFLPFIGLARVALAAFIVTLTLNSFAIWLAYRGLVRLIGVRAALVASALMAVSPWLIEDSRRTWVQSLMPFFVALIFWALVPVLTRQTRHPERRLLIALTGSAIFANTYLLAYAIFAPVGLLILLFWRRIPWRTLIVGLGVIAILLTLYGIGLIRQWEDTRWRIDNFFSGDSHLTDEALSHAVRLVTGWEYAAARGVDAPVDDAATRADISQVVHIFWAVILSLGIVKAVYSIVRRSLEREVSLILLIWFLLPIMLMSYSSRQVHPFYLILSVPAGFGLAAWALKPLLTSPIGIRVIVSMLVFTGLVNGLNSIRFAQETAAAPGEHYYTLPLAEAIAIGHDIRSGYEDGMVVYTPFDEWTPSVIAGRIMPVVRSEKFDQMVMIPRQGGLYVVVDRPGEVLVPILHGTIARYPFRYLDDGTRVTVWQVHQRFTPRQSAEISSDIGVSFTGWHLQEPLRPGQTTHLRTYWRVDNLYPDQASWNFVPFNHVFDGNGDRILIVDGVRAPSDTWQVGDWMLQELTLDIPTNSSGPYAVSVGLFDGVRMVSGIFNFAVDGEMVWTANLEIIR